METIAKVSTVAGVALATCFVLASTACGGSGSSAARQSEQASKQLQTQVYQSKNNIEFRNYNLRQKLADSPATILWCTFFPPGVQGAANGSAAGQAFTIPIAGKLTSSNKRPYQSVHYSNDNQYETPGPDHMFGSSAEYRYGFDPTLAIYSDFTDLPSYCTTAPTVWQAQKTTVIVQTDKTLGDLTSAASAAIKAGEPEKALALLEKADSR